MSGNVHEKMRRLSPDAMILHAGRRPAALVYIGGEYRRMPIRSMPVTTGTDVRMAVEAELEPRT